jgi:ELWxxDGT repeat protein
MAKASGGADGRLNGAKVLGLPTSFGNKVGLKDSDDLFRFSSSDRSSFSLELSGVKKKANVDVELYKFSRPVNDVLKSIGKTDFRKIKGKDRNTNFQLVSASKNGNNSNESIALDLDSGEYFVRVLQKKGDSNYTLALNSTAIIEPPTIFEPPVDIAPDPGTPGPVINPVTPRPSPIPTPGNSFETATAGTLTAPNTGKVDSSDPQDYYKFSLAAPGDYQFNLSGLSADANLEVFTSSNTSTPLKSSSNTGTSDEKFIQPLDAGDYYVRVSKASGTTTNYSLAVSKRTDLVGDAETDATSLGTLTSAAINRSNYAVTGGKDSPADVYKFTTSSRGFVKVDVSGLFGNLDVDLYPEGQTSSAGLVSNGPGTNAEVFGGTLSAGNYYLRVRPADGSVQGSTYNLQLTFTSKNTLPSINRDINNGAAGSAPKNLTEVNGIAYFSASDGGKTALWSSTGTLNGTKKIKEFASEPSNFTKVGSIFYFVANDGQSGSELWKSDGTTAGTQRVADINPGAAPSDPSKLTAVGNSLYFLATPTGDVNDKALYRLKPGDTAPVAVTSSDLLSKTVDKLKSIGNTLYFAGFSKTGGGTELWKIDDSGQATVAPTLIDLNPNGSSSPDNFTQVGNSLFLSAKVLVGASSQRELIRINPTSPDPVTSLATFNLNDDTDSNPGNLAYDSVSNTLYFTATGKTTAGGDSVGTELWKLSNPGTAPDGTTPTLVKDINTTNAGGTDTNSSNPSNLVLFNNKLYFIADAGTGNALWTTDGSDAGTKQLGTVVNSLAGLTDPKKLIVAGNSLYFVATDAAHGEELWQTDGATTANTNVFDIKTGTNSSQPDQLTNVGGQLFFVADNGTNGSEVWSV